MSPFTRFSELPLEIRDKIWTFALPCLRFVHVFVADHTESTPERQQHNGIHDHNGLYGIRFSTQVPVLLGVCKESRVLALKYYPPQFHNRLVGFPHKPRLRHGHFLLRRLEDCSWLDSQLIRSRVVDES